MFKKIILSAVAIATLTTGVFGATQKAEMANAHYWIQKNTERRAICDDTVDFLPRTQMSYLKADIGDLTISSVGRNGTLGIGRSITLNQICWKYYQEVEDSQDEEFKRLMDKYIKINTTGGNNDATRLSFLYSLHNQPKQESDVLASFAKGDIQKTKKLLEQYIWKEDLAFGNTFVSEVKSIVAEGGNDTQLIKMYEDYKSRKYKSDLIVSWMKSTIDINEDERVKLLSEINNLTN